MKIRALAIVSALALPTLAFAGDKAPTDTPPTNPSKPDTFKPNTPKADTSKSSDTGAPSDPANKTAKLSDGDTKIVAHLHHVNQMEIDVGKVAQKSGTTAVKNYGATLVTDHQSADKDLAAFATSHKLATIPADKPQADADKQEEKAMGSQMTKLKTLKGADFDREFLNMMAAGHEKELTKIDVAIGAATDPDLQMMLKSVKPVLQRHADQARDLQKNAPQASTDPAATDKSLH